VTGLARAFRVFHVTLALVVLWLSVATVRGGLAAFRTDPHPAVIGGIEAVAALLFLVPRTLVAGAWLLLAVFAVALALHGLRHELASPLLVYAAGVWLVMRHQIAARAGRPDRA